MGGICKGPVLAAVCGLLDITVQTHRINKRRCLQAEDCIRMYALVSGRCWPGGSAAEEVEPCGGLAAHHVLPAGPPGCAAHQQVGAVEML